MKRIILRYADGEERLHVVWDHLVELCRHTHRAPSAVIGEHVLAMAANFGADDVLEVVVSGRPEVDAGGES